MKSIILRLSILTLPLLVFGPLAAQALTAATPTFSPAAGSYTGAQNVSISDATAGAAIYYTTDGSTPTIASLQYTAPITVAASETVNAIAVVPGYTTSLTGSAAYVINSSTVGYSETFTGANTNNLWYYFKGACLTAGTTAASVPNNNPGTSTAVPGYIPSCQSMTVSPYYWYGRTPLVGGSNGSIPGTDPTYGGALRFTNTGGQQAGAILSDFSFPLSSQGLQVTFVTETYEGDSGGGDGADGISFFLQNATQLPDLGATGGSLAYSCTNETGNYDSLLRVGGDGLPRGYDGLPGAYIGVGIDEYGNFLNGSNSTNGNAPSSAGDNTASGASNINGGANFQGGRIGIRGAGNVAWTWLNTNYNQYYTNAMTAIYPTNYSTSAASEAVRVTCETGYVQKFTATTNSTTGAITGSFAPVTPLIRVPDYTALAYANLPSGVKIANESATLRGNGTSTESSSKYGVPISYNLNITTGGLLTLSYSYNGGASIYVINGYNIGTLPSNVRFGFAGSDGGSTNIHEVMCFQAAPQTTAQSSATGNQKQSAPVVTGTQVYYSYYNPASWSGSVVSDSLLVNTTTNSVYIGSTANWDASCVLTGTGTATTCPTTGEAPVANPESPASRVMLTWSGSGGIPFEWTNLTATEQGALDTGDGVTQPYRLNYLRGVRTNEETPTGTGAYTSSSPSYPPFRDRVSVLGDIIDSSPTWVGPPSAGYPATWSDKYQTSDVMTENSGQNYPAFTTQEQSRVNVVYAGANDGFLHGFRSGYFDSSGNYVGTGSGSTFVGTQNDGYEVLSYMPGYVLNHIQTTTSALNYSDPQYGHQFEVDATPGTGDVYYGGMWHTLLVGGLGAGGAGIFALDVTNPATSPIAASPVPPDPTFSESNASTIVIGDWSTTTSGATTTSTLPCVNTTSTTTSAANCGLNLGNTYGTPQIRRFHNGQWGAVFGNGFGSSTGDAGIYVMLLNTTTGAPTFYYLSTGQASGAGDGIGFVSTADLDGDHITDYVYAGDLLGNVWRFDLTSTNPAQWAASSIGTSTTPTPIFYHILKSADYQQAVHHFGAFDTLSTGRRRLRYR